MTSPAPAAKKPSQRRRCGPYALGPVIGEGAQGTVRSGVRIVEPGGPIKPVCLKLLGRGGKPTAEQKRAFEIEIAIASRVEHQNIVSLFDADPDDPEGGWLALQLVQGVNLATLLESLPDHRLSPELAIFVAANLSRAFRHLHESRGDVAQLIVHRDVSPKNVLISAEGEVKLADFGLARMIRVLRQVQSRPAGTLEYMAPEQKAGHAVDARSDLFSLGVMLYEMLAGRRPMLSRLGSELSAGFAGREYPRLSELVEVPSRLQAVVECLMQPDPERRFASARAFLRALSELAGAELRLDVNLDERLGKLVQHSDGYTRIDHEAVLREYWASADLPEESSPSTLGRPAGTQMAADESTPPVSIAASSPWQKRAPVRLGVSAVLVAVGAFTWTQLNDHGAISAGQTSVSPSLPVASEPTTSRTEAKPLPEAPSAAEPEVSAGSSVSLQAASGATDPGPGQPREVGARLNAEHELNAEPSRSVGPLAPLSQPAPPADRPAPAQRGGGEAESRPRTAATATLTVGALPSARVWIDKKSAGWSPVDVTVAPGRHSIALGATRPDKATLRWVTVRSGEHLDVLFDDGPQQPLADSGGR